jgi:hypothetical protein
MDGNRSAHSTIPLDNSGRGPLQVPGFNSIPIHYELKSEDRFAHGEREWRQTPGVTAREQAMVDLMNKLTDKPGWHVDVFNDEIVDKWRENAFKTCPLMSEKAWSWCLAELRDKAIYFTETKHVRVLDTGSCVCKSDTPELQSLAASFRSAATPLLDQHRSNKDWQPTSDDPILNIVDPSLFPLVYGRSLVLKDGGYVDLQDIFGSYKDTTIAPKHFDRRTDSEEVQEEIKKGQILSTGVHPLHSESEFYRWSSNYQWLPCDIEFAKDTGTEVRLTSYINNLHPAHESLYRDIEKLISISIPLWNDCLIRGRSGFGNRRFQGQLGPVPLRILTYGIEWENELPEWGPSFNVPPEFRKMMYRKLNGEVQRINTLRKKTNEDKERLRWAQRRLEGFVDVVGKEDMELPPLDSDIWRKAREYLELPEDNNGSKALVAVPENWTQHPWLHIRRKLSRLLHFKHPEPGISFSYEDWKTGTNNNKAIIDIVSERPEWDSSDHLMKPVVPDFKPYTINLQDTFRKQGLQVIVQIESVELTPDNPVYYAGSWQLPGQLNEHIVAMTMFPYDVENIANPLISFRQETHIHDCFYRYDEEKLTPGGKIHYNDQMDRPLRRYGKHPLMEVDALTEILGFPPLHLYRDHWVPRAFQCKGSVTTPQGRLTTFPNVMEHRLENFKLVNPIIPGHYRVVKLHLVDPHYRVCSTRNVPPQQHHWWANEISNSFLLENTMLPQELVDEIFKGTENWPMGMEEAEKHRLQMMKEHRWNDLVRIGSMPGYTFM